MQPRSLDHIAIYVSDRDGITTRLCDELDVHVIDRTDRYTLVGSSATAGKITLFDPPGSVEPEPSWLVSLLLADPRGSHRHPLVLDQGLTITFGMHEQALAAAAPRHSVIGATLRNADPPITAADYVSRYGFRTGGTHRDVATVSVGAGVITLVRERSPAVEQPMLFHLGLLVDSAQAHIDAAQQNGVEVLDVVDAANTHAVFVQGPDDVTIEYVEHKPEFALT